MSVRVRLAPSPTGTLHIGTARTALFNWLFARKHNGKFLLRIEDTDKERSKPEYIKNILKGLEWLKIDFDEELVIQSERIHSHKKFIKKLLDEGFAYRCYANEVELNEMRNLQKLNGEPPRYDNRGRNITRDQEKQFIEEGRSSVVRFRIDENEIIEWDDLIRGKIQWKGKDLGGDMVISRRCPSSEIGEPLYNLVVVIDDNDMDISHVIRGEDHISNTAKQILLYRALGLKIPEFAHTPLILNSEGKKLSKRDGVTSIEEFKKMGYLSEAMANYMTLLGWSPPEGMNEQFSMEEASKIFSFDRVNKAGAKFDWDKLNWLNSQRIHGLSSEELLEELKPFWSAVGWEIPNNDWALSLCNLIGPSLTTLKGGVEEGRPFFEKTEAESDALKQLEINEAQIGLSVLVKELENKPWNGKDLNIAKEIIQITSEKSKVKKGIIMRSLRAALLGRLKGPDLLTTWSLLAETNQDRIRIKEKLN